MTMLNEFPTPEPLPADVLELNAETMARIYGPMRYECLTCRVIYASFNDFIFHHDPACAAPCLHPWRDRRDACVLYPRRDAGVAVQYDDHAASGGECPSAS